ncbi:MAG: DUF3450 domain-containing protein [Woeseia sp.]|nr:DUF3450 domain-containing protein [Woeseia sp.]
MKTQTLTSAIAGTLLFVMALSAEAQSQAERVVELQAQGLKTSADAQDRIDSLDDETRDMLNEYRQTMSQVSDLGAYNDQLEGLVATQRVELADFERQFQEIEITKRRILPLIVRMIEVLKEFVAIDIPFLEKERGLRIAALEALLARPEVPTSEKYRRTMEAYQVEMEYGHTIEAYEGEMVVDGEARTVNFLRYGRLGLYYMTLDGREIGYWDNNEDSWVELPGDYRQSLDRAIRIARKQLPPDLTRLPVPAPEDRT